jgi:hypothetical protein
MARWLYEARLRDVVPTVALFDRLVDVVAHASILGAYARWFGEFDASRITTKMPLPPTKVQWIVYRHSCLPRPSRKEEKFGVESISDIFSYYFFKTRPKCAIQFCSITFF